MAASFFDNLHTKLGVGKFHYAFLTQKERDIESGLDYFLARYYSSAQGRFTSTDPIFVTLRRMIDPQELNLHAYVRNNPLRFVDLDGLELLIEAKKEEEARKKFNLLQRGLTVQDRKHVRLVVGDGKNGFAKGQFGVVVDAAYKSKSENFQALQTIANDKQERAILSVRGPKDTFPSNVGVKEGETVVIKSFKDIFGVDNYVSRKDAVAGQTLFQLRGSPEADVIYSASKNTEVYVANDNTADEIVATMHHELRHVYLSNVGRDEPRSRHNAPGVNAATKAAETEAKQNFRKR